MRSPRTDANVPVLVVGADGDADAIRYYQAGADITLPSEGTPLLIAAARGARLPAAQGADNDPEWCELGASASTRMRAPRASTISR